MLSLWSYSSMAAHLTFSLLFVSLYCLKLHQEIKASFRASKTGLGPTPPLVFYRCSKEVDLLQFFFELSHDKTFNKTWSTSEDSDQPAHPRRLIRVFADRRCLLQLPYYQKRDTWTPCHTGWMYRLIWVFAGHTGLFVSFIVHWLLYLWVCGFICDVCVRHLLLVAREGFAPWLWHFLGIFTYIIA